MNFTIGYRNVPGGPKLKVIYCGTEDLNAALAGPPRILHFFEGPPPVHAPTDNPLVSEGDICIWVEEVE